jgi:hypothetical protein
MIIPLLDAIFNSLVQLTALCSLALAVNYGLIYWRAVRTNGWGSCSVGFTRYARDMFWLTVSISIIFGVWSARLWAFPDPVHIWERWLGEVTYGGVAALFAVELDLLREALPTRSPPRFLFWGAVVVITAANLAAFLIQG